MAAPLTVTLPRRALTHPVEFIRTRLLRDKASSLAIGALTDVPASTVRSIKQGVTHSMDLRTWRALMSYLGELR